MNLISRIYQLGLKLFVLLFPFPRPKLYVGETGTQEWLADLNTSSRRRFLLVTDQTLLSLDLLKPLFSTLEQQGIAYHVFADVQPNPTIDNVEQGLTSYHDHQCEGIICVGGGSVMDCAKLIGARVAQPNKSVIKLKGLFKVLKATPPLYAIPTTAGTGSETTIVAVVSDPTNQQKYAVTDLALTPDGAVLIPELTKKLPAAITATTGMDALTHAIESYIGINTTSFTRHKSLTAIKLIFNHLERAYENGEDLQARENMLLASFYAGEAFTRASVGYVHAIAHQLGALYNAPHGLANSVILPRVLHWYGDSINNKLADIADFCELTVNNASPADKAKAVIKKIEQMNVNMQIPHTMACIKTEDIIKIAKMALKEAHPDYPVPRFMRTYDCVDVVTQIAPVNN